MSKKTQVPVFLQELLTARSPSGAEGEAQIVWDQHVAPASDETLQDALGNRISILNPKGNPTVFFAGHMDQLGLIVRHVDDKGFIYFDTIGGFDRLTIPGRAVEILTRKGTVAGVTGKKAIHLQTEADRNKVPELHQMWIDIGASSKEEALKQVSIGDPVVFVSPLRSITDRVISSRALDNKTGCYVVGEALRRLAKETKKKLAARVVSVATSQEEIGTRGATVSAQRIVPEFSLTVDVHHATDHPDCDARQVGLTHLGKGPIINRGPNVNPIVLEKLIAVAEKEKIPYQMQALARPASNDARAIQMAGQGVATGVVAVPLRYMHTPSEMIDLEDLENCVKLLVGFALSLRKGETGCW
jgi:putative aminopeptidase FrvX